MSQIPERLKALRAEMATHGLTHYLVPSSDEHLNEYLPPWGMRREFISGFRGSAGDVVVGLEDAWLFADGRYHLQAEIELAHSTMSLSKVGAAGQKTLLQFLTAEARKRPGETVVGYDPMVLAVGTAEAYQRSLTNEGAEWKPVLGNLVDRTWKDRPEPVTSALVAVSPEWAGASTAQKLEKVRKDLESANATGVSVIKLDQLAWLMNLRSKDDIPFNPVFEGYGFVDRSALHLFVHRPQSRLPAEVRKTPGLAVHDYGGFLGFLAALPKGTRVLLDPTGVTMGVKKALQDNKNVTVIQGESPVEAAKARKNEAERESMRRANRRASAAKTRALLWLEREIAAGKPVTERSFQDEIERVYSRLEGYWGLSFDTISATGAHGAIVHYKDADQTQLARGDLFLIDSGTQVAGGTTDDTRTVAVGECDAEKKRIYTLVLKAHINAASATFPAGVPGTAIDALCRGVLWQERLVYDHGTGHGVGCFLNVHEGPFALSERERKPFAVTPLAEGMVTSIEPGYYRTGWGGIRLENLYLIVDSGKDGDGRQWLKFDPITFIPFDRRLIDRSMLSSGEQTWLDDYHRRCAEELKGELTADEIGAMAG